MSTRASSRATPKKSPAGKRPPPKKAKEPSSDYYESSYEESEAPAPKQRSTTTTTTAKRGGHLGKTKKGVKPLTSMFAGRYEEDTTEEPVEEDTEQLRQKEELGLAADKDSLLSDVMSTRAFQWKSTAHSILRSLNMYRETVKKPLLADDWRLFRVAMAHSRKMAKKEATVNADLVAKQLKEFPFIDFFAEVASFSSMDNAFTNVVNQWTTDNKVSKVLLMDFNCAGVGVAVNEENNNDIYFTLILGLRTVIGHSYYSGTTLRSVLLAEQCLELVNKMRHDEFQLLPIRLDLQLCDMAYRFANMDTKELTDEYVREKVGICSLWRISYGGVDDKKATPKMIVENWMNQMGKSKTLLSDFNRVGYGFVVKKDTGLLFSVCLYVRSLEAAVIDGTETIVDGSILASQIFDMMNEFRDQHSLPPLNYDSDLCLAAQDHTEYIANGQKGANPLDGDFFVCDVEPRYVATDISHMSCSEISRAPKSFMAKWRNNVDCISVLLNQIDDIGIGVCFDRHYVCHITVIIASFGNDGEVTNIIYRL